MPQNSIVLPVVGTFSGLTEQGYINNALASLDTDWSGNAAPGSPTTGRRFLNTNVAALFTRQVYDGASWVTFDQIDTVNHLILPYRGNWPMQKQGAALTAAATLTLGTDGDDFTVTGSTGITAISSRPAGCRVTLTFTGTPLITHNATSLILQGGANLQIVAGDTMELVSEGSGNWRQIGVPANQQASGALVFLGAYTAANSANLSITGKISATYDEYQIDFDKLRPQTNQVSLLCRVSDDNGATYKTSSYAYNVVGALAGSGFTDNSSSAGSIQISRDAGNIDSLGNGLAESISGSLRFFPNGTAKYKHLFGQTSWLQDNGTFRFGGARVDGIWRGTTALNAFQFRMSSGLIVDGAAYIYGVKKV